MSYNIALREIRNFRCRYHRNGVAGIGFYACSFLWRNGRQWTAMQAAVFPNESGKCDGRVAVMSHDVDDAWRGDTFEPALRALIAAAGDSAFAPIEGKRHA